MELNTPQSLALGREIHELFGSWREVRAAGKSRDGKLVLDADAIKYAKARRRERLKGTSSIGRG